MKNKRFLIVLILALIIKLSLFVYAEINAPRVKFQEDTKMYIKIATNLIEHRIFTFYYSGNDKYPPEIFRTPGYSLFLGFCHDLMKIPYFGIVFVQIILTIFAAYFTYKTALIINSKFAFLSFFIILYDPPITIFSLMLLTETLFLFLISIFMYAFVLFLKTKKIKFIFIAALFLAVATYVRPASYYLGLVTGLFLIYPAIRTKFKKMLIHMLVFLIIVYALIGLWHLRNYKLTGKKVFTTWETEFGHCYRKDRIRDDKEFTKLLPPVLYYMNAVSRCILSLMTDPGSFKDFNSEVLKFIGKIIAYPWMVFWLIGFIIGTAKIEKNFYLQFLILVVLYFIAVSVGAVLFGIGPRFRVPMMPFIAIISANGWLQLFPNFNKRT